VASAKPPPRPKCRDAEAALFRDDGQLLGVACDVRHLAVLDATGQVQHIDLPEVAPLPDADWSDAVLELVWSPDGKTLAVLRADGVRLWSVEQGTWALTDGGGPKVLATGGEAMAGATFHPSRPLVAVFPRTRVNRVMKDDPPKGGVSIYDTTTGKQVAHLPDLGHIHQVAWHPDGDRLVVGGGTESSGMHWSWAAEHLRVWSTKRQKKLRELPGHTIHFAKNGRRAAIDRGHPRQGGTDAMGYEQTGAEVDLRSVRGWTKLATTKGSLAGISDDGLQLALNTAARGRAYVHWRVGRGKPKPVNDANGSARIVEGTHDQFVIDAGDGSALQQLGKPAQPIPDLGYVRRAGFKLFAHAIGWRSRDEAVHDLHSKRSLHVDAAMVGGTCRLAVEERTTGAFAGESEAIAPARACVYVRHRSKAPPKETPQLLSPD
jgi:hypothetical protein